MTVFRIAVLLCCALGGLQAQSVELAKVASRPVERTLRLPGEFFPYQRVELHARVTGFVERVPVDRGSAVKQGDLLVVLSAPEMTAQVVEAEAKAQVAEAHRAEAEAKVVAVESTYERLKTAAATPGAVAGIELIQAEKALEAARASLRATEMAAKAAASSVAALRELTARV
jgi:membrane fusion protein, multidrug efflux system